jgi:DNA-binding XRE family transcriptional regulator
VITKVSLGYSANTILLNKKADVNRLGVSLGRAAIKKGVSVVDIASSLSVSRQTVYNWFVGAYDPKADQAKNIAKLLARLK